MDMDDKLDVSSYDASWDKWRTEQVQTITQILSTVFKVEDEARQMQAPSRLLRRSSMDSPEAEAEIHKKLTQIRQQISEYEAMLKLGLKRVDNALEKIEPLQYTRPKITPEISIKPVSRFKRLIEKLKLLFTK
ncbi:MAG: hypothetical protein ACRDFB_08685 [Rhabdochlamydiaceae bacterium]